MLYLLSLLYLTILLTIDLSGRSKILCVNEFVEAPAVDTYKSNYPNTPVLPDDIKKLNNEDFLKIAIIQKSIDLDILDVFLATLFNV